MIGYYVHDHGSGHLHRAQAVASVWGQAITGLSALPRPAGWPGGWLQLDHDTPVQDPVASDVTAKQHLHWTPLKHPGLCSRMGAISAWITEARPSLFVCDVSVEVALLARLHGIKVVSVVLPGNRGDAAHLLGYGVSDTLVALWPASARVGTGLPTDLTRRIRHLGGLSRFTSTGEVLGSSRGRRVAVLCGSGGVGLTQDDLQAAQAQSPDWVWTVLGGTSWIADPFPAVCSADVVLTHAGQNAIAEVAAARRPAIVLPEMRPFHEQHMTAEALREQQWPAVILDEFPQRGWDQLLERADRLDGQRWSAWCDGQAAERFAQVLREVSAS